MAMMITYLCMSYDKKKSSNEKEERVDHLCLISIDTLNIFQDMKTYSSTST
jgi:tRNA(Phe) wybutosine-synthesizing methylase Tyw3